MADHELWSLAALIILEELRKNRDIVALFITLELKTGSEVRYGIAIRVLL